MSLEIYGDPAIPVNDIVALPQIELEPQKLDEELIIDMGYQNSYTFAIKNTGEAKLKWQITPPDFVNVDKLQGENEPQSSISITLTRKELELLVAPRQRKGKLIIKTNDINRAQILISICAKGLFAYG